MGQGGGESESLCLLAGSKPTVEQNGSQGVPLLAAVTRLPFGGVQYIGWTVCGLWALGACNVYETLTYLGML